MRYLFIMLFLLAATALAQPQAPIADSRDGKTYRAVKIGEQVWMAENLNYEAEGSMCYENKAENCAKYGRLYDWDAAMKACPKGWHLSKTLEWGAINDLIDTTSFPDIHGGYLDSDGFSSVGKSGLWWSASDLDSDIPFQSTEAYCKYLHKGHVGGLVCKKATFYSVRCVRD